jgi:penicillin amidase
MPTKTRRDLSLSINNLTARRLSAFVLVLMLVAMVTAFPHPVLAAKRFSLAETRSEKIARSVTIYRDTYGVPHVYGPTDASCVFGYIYAQAEDNFWQIEDTFIRALGRASEVYGDRTLADDMLNRALEIPRLAKAEYDRISGRERELSHALVAG